MAAVRTYFTALKNAVNDLGRSMGVDLNALPKPERVALYGALAAVSVVCRALVDAGRLTDQQLQTALSAAYQESWPDEPITPSGG